MLLESRLKRLPTTAQPDLDFRRIGRGGISQRAKRVWLDVVERIIKPLDFERCFAILENGEIWTKDGSESIIEFDPVDKHRLKNAILTHNHPASGPFSWEDIYFAVETDLAELRAVRKRGDTESLVRPPGGWPPIEKIDAWRKDATNALFTYLQRRQEKGLLPLSHTETVKKLSLFRAKHRPTDIRDPGV